MKVLTGLGFSMVWLLVACGGNPQVVTQKVYEDPNREVGLQVCFREQPGERVFRIRLFSRTPILPT